MIGHEAGAIRLATLHDLGAVVALDRNIDCLPHWAAAEYRAAIEGHKQQPLRCVYVAEAGGAIVGVVVGMVQTIAGECSGELETVGVAPTMQRRGLGRRLCVEVLQWCRSCGAMYIDLEVRSRSAGPLALYRELGFEVTGGRRGYYRDPADDAVLMRLRLDGGLEQPALVGQEIR